jgi:hypothetical protein
MTKIVKKSFDAPDGEFLTFSLPDAHEILGQALVIESGKCPA